MALEEEDADAGEQPAVAAPGFDPAELTGRPLADLHRLAAEAGVARYRLLRREQLIAALSGEEVAVPQPAPAPPPRPAPSVEPPVRREVKSLEELEGESPPPADLGESPVTRPNRLLPLGDGLAERMVQIVAPLGCGQRALITGPGGSGATFLLRELGRGLAGACDVRVVLIDVRPEEVPEWESGLDVSAADAGSSPRAQVALAEHVLEDARRAAEGGEDVVVLLDSLSRLARAYALAGRDRADAVEAAKRWFASARDAGAGHGSLTLIAVARVEPDSTFEALVQETLADSANAVLRLSGELASRRMFPALDPERSRTLGEEALIGEDRRHTLENMRGVARSLDPPEAWDFLAERAREGS